MEDSQYYAPDMSRLNALLVVLALLFALACGWHVWMWVMLEWGA